MTMNTVGLAGVFGGKTLAPQGVYAWSYRFEMFWVNTIPDAAQVI